MSDAKLALLERAQRAEQRGNREVRDLWERYRGHRERLTAEILALAPAGGRVALLGAGNGNDVDLAALAARFDEIHLVDLDPGALSRATGRQDPSVRARLRSHAPVDLSGLYHQLAPGRRVPSVDDLVTAGAAALLPQLPAPLDVVVSCCVLSQMSWALEHLLAPDETTLALLQQALLRIHLRTMVAVLRPTGAALLATDVVSSNVYPLDDLPPDADLRALAAKLASEGVAYPVCNPDLVKLIIRRDPVLATACHPPTLGEPWLWHGPKDLTYLVCPLRLHPLPREPSAAAGEGQGGGVRVP